jgi:hypothetical protein
MKESGFDQLTVHVTFDSERGYIATAPELPQPVFALSLGSLNHQVEKMLGNPIVKLHLDKVARRERDQRRRGGSNTERYPWPTK